MHSTPTSTPCELLFVTPLAMLAAIKAVLTVNAMNVFFPQEDTLKQPTLFHISPPSGPSYLKTAFSITEA